MNEQTKHKISMVLRGRKKSVLHARELAKRCVSYAKAHSTNKP